MSITSSTPKTSRSSGAVLGFSGSTSSSSGASFFLAMVFFLGSFQSACLFFQAPRVFVHSVHLTLNQSEGVSSSIRCVRFLSRIHFRRYSSQSALLAQTNLTSSKPSSFSARLNLAYEADSSLESRSGVSFFQNTAAFSSSVSSTLTSTSASSAPSTFASSSGSALGSSSSFFASLPFLLASSFLFRSSAAFFLFSSSAFLRCASTFLRLASASALARFSLSIPSWTQVLNSSGGWPIKMHATLLNSGPGKRASVACLSSAVRLPLTCATT
mmetsp:Transcript_33511/g.77896  ORF Transcript_33511/g.77896 Transcript_33511/m.77896 type:complete len:271 (+) Transcript_33511:775-1587(+)